MKIMLMRQLIFYVNLLKNNKKTRQGLGRNTKFSTKVGSKRFKKKYRGQGK